MSIAHSQSRASIVLFCVLRDAVCVCLRCAISSNTFTYTWIVFLFSMYVLLDSNYFFFFISFFLYQKTLNVNKFLVFPCCDMTGKKCCPDECLVCGWCVLISWEWKGFTFLSSVRFFLFGDSSANLLIGIFISRTQRGPLSWSFWFQAGNLCVMLL